ncbi:MAG: stress-responsive transcriptional regulator PspC [Eubacteriaceae bacterium]
MTKKILMSIAGVVLGIMAGLTIAATIEKKQEKKMGGKLMNVHYRFTKDFED